MAAVTCELKWLNTLLFDLGIEHPKVVQLFRDNRSALYIAKNLVFHEHTKHIEIDCHFVRDVIQDKLISPLLVSLNTQLADIFTKALGENMFQYILDKLGTSNPHAPT